MLEIITVNPLKACRIKVQLMESRLAPVEFVQVGHPLLETGMRLVLKQVPLKAFLMCPLPPLAELVTHEQQLLTRLGIHIAEKQPQVGEFLPVVARHLTQQGTLTVDDLIVRQRQCEVLVKGIYHAEGQTILVVLAVDRVLAHVFQGVVHPAHVPFHAETEPAEVGGAGYHRPRCRFLGDCLHVGIGFVNDLVELF